MMQVHVASFMHAVHSLQQAPLTQVTHGMSSFLGSQVAPPEVEPPESVVEEELPPELPLPSVVLEPEVVGLPEVPGPESEAFVVELVPVEPVDPAEAPVVVSPWPSSPEQAASSRTVTARIRPSMTQAYRFPAAHDLFPPGRTRC